MSIKDDNITKMLSNTVKKSPILKTLGINPDWLIIKYDSTLPNIKQVLGGFQVRITFGPASLENIKYHITDALHQIHKYKLRRVMEVTKYVRVNIARNIWMKEVYIGDQVQGVFPLLHKNRLKIERHQITVITDTETGESVKYLDNESNETSAIVELSKKIAELNVSKRDKEG
jgi:hypothetical protein